ncbi:hypothetical protein FRC18_001329 [Serendipita sp. 400]|nr:hypothetical protein FRC18_001329 [Serendipita sp. 400]
MSRSAPYAYENPYASVPTTDGPSASSSSSSSTPTPMSYPPSFANNTANNANAIPLRYASPPSTSGHGQGYGQGYHRPMGSISANSVTTLKGDEMDESPPKQWSGTPDEDDTKLLINNNNNAYDPYHRRTDSEPFDPNSTPTYPSASAAASTYALPPRPPGPGHGINRHDPKRWSYDDSILLPSGVRIFSPAWFKYHWAVQSSRKRLGRLLYVASGFISLLVWLIVTVLFGNNLESHELSNSSFSVNGSGALPHPPDRIGTLFLVGQLNSFDPVTRNLNIDWTAVQVEKPLNEQDLLSTQIDIDRRTDTVPLAMFRDVLAVPDTNTNITDYQPFRVQNPFVKPVGYLGLTQFDQINTNIGLGQKSTNIWLQPEFGYPFDVYQGKITWVAANNQTITATGRPGVDVQAISGAILTDSLLNMRVRSQAFASCLYDNEPGCELVIQIWVTRTGLVKFCVFVVFVIHWFVTIALFLLTGESLLLNRHNILESTDIFAVCFSALFALPSVRSLLPGVPGYGCVLDMLGILPNMIIITLCTVFFAISRLRHRYRHAAAEAAAAKDE